jgi:hypothetical protein
MEKSNLKPRRMLKTTLVLLAALGVWVILDLTIPYTTNIKKIDAAEAARLDGEMWRSYYERKPVRLFLQAAELIRKQFHAPFWRSYVMAYHSAKSAFIFKDGTNRSEYARALPNLTAYFQRINDLSDTRFNVDSAAQLELEWWIIRRYRHDHPPEEWEKYIAATAEAMYHIPAEEFAEYAHLRTEAMLLRDAKGEAITEQDWVEIHELLRRAWFSFERALGSSVR